ncbi:MAG: MBL fold metallo-hydrolase, partial [Stomatobaculum sp.]|nr:MBL fold metallo-hydrolase [Stomatobaculum sp.]
MKIEIKRMVLGPVQTNVYYVINPETKECVILDPADNAPRIRMAVNKLGVTPVAIFLTHGHFDHIDAADEVRKMFGIKIYALDKE